jgi:sterol desaturase/sphingolipid hydroxylase (fatty acid hydroxylase superfamily)
MHRIAHIIPLIKNLHWDHHKYINSFQGNNWHWSNLFLYNDNWKSTADLWITEVFPTILFCLITSQWWIFIFYYLWAALAQEIVEHNPKVNLYPFFTFGKWHLKHHTNHKCNYGLFFPIFDLLFKTNNKN